MYIIYGPTGVGKSDLALELAQHMSAEIINMDVGQFYTPFSIGTAKPDWKRESTVHHLFDIIDTPQNYTVVSYRKRVIELIHDIRSRGSTPILVGGSGFYLKTLFFPLSSDLSLQDGIRNDDTQFSWDTLYAVDAKRAEAIQPQDTYRIERALAIWERTGKKPSEYGISYDNIFGSYHIISVQRDAEDLYERINARTYRMLQAGWVDEVRSLVSTPWQSFIEEKKLIGYNEILSFLNDPASITYDDLIKKIQKRTRRYAKRQRTFWRMLERLFTTALHTCRDGTLTTVNLTSSDHAIYIKQLLQLHDHVKGYGA